MDVLDAQLADLQPEGGHAVVGVDAPPYGRMLSGIRGLRLQILGVDAKFKYDDANPVEHRERVSDRLEERDHGLDRGAAAQQRDAWLPDRRLEGPTGTSHDHAVGRSPPWALAVVAMLSVQLGFSPVRGRDRRRRRRPEPHGCA